MGKFKPLRLAVGAVVAGLAALAVATGAFAATTSTTSTTSTSTTSTTTSPTPPASPAPGGPSQFPLSQAADGDLGISSSDASSPASETVVELPAPESTEVNQGQLTLSQGIEQATANDQPQYACVITFHGTVNKGNSSYTVSWGNHLDCNPAVSHVAYSAALRNSSSGQNMAIGNNVNQNNYTTGASGGPSTFNGTNVPKMYVHFAGTILFPSAGEGVSVYVGPGLGSDGTETCEEQNGNPYDVACVSNSVAFS